MRGPLNRYRQLIAQGFLQPDQAQEAAVQQLEKLHRQLTTRAGFRFWRRPESPRGLYIWGSVGGGKSLLMDLFFNNTSFQPKRRVHFHNFMVEMHEAIADWRAMDNRTRKKQRHYDSSAALDDPIPHIANLAYQQARLLCFDEFQVTDIADAMLLGRLFQSLLGRGGVIVATSNRPPDDLYKDGLNRQLFVPFIDLLRAKLDIHKLDAEKDYRLGQLSGNPVYYTPLNEETAAAFDEAWTRLKTGATQRPTTLTVKGRALHLPMTARDAVRTSFAALCERPLGAEDYLAIATNFTTVFLENIPRLTPASRNEAKRFVTLIDALYEAKTKLVCTAATRAEDLYPQGDGAFEFERTVSRLIEMQSEAYLAEERRTPC